jgi:hypothetical protein
VKEGQLITSRFARAGGSAKLNPESYRDTSIKPAFSNKGFEKPYSADYEVSRWTNRFNGLQKPLITSRTSIPHFV